MTISRTMRTAAPLLALTMALTLGACGTEQDDPSGPTTSESTNSDTAPTSSDAAPTSDDGTATEEPSVTPIPTDPADPSDGTALPTGPVADAVLERDDVKAAIADLAKTQSVEPDQVTVAGFHEVTWNDGSIGCPQPGMMYTQALVPGSLLVLEVDGELFAYNGANGKAYTYCADPHLPRLDATM